MGMFTRRRRRDPADVTAILYAWEPVDPKPFAVETGHLERAHCTTWAACMRYWLPAKPDAFLTIWAYSADGPDGFFGVRCKYEWAVGADDPASGVSEPDWSHAGFCDHPDCAYYDRLTKSDDAAAELIRALAADADGIRHALIFAFDWDGEPFVAEEAV